MSRRRRRESTYPATGPPEAQWLGEGCPDPLGVAPDAAPGRVRTGCLPGARWLADYWDPQRLVDAPEEPVLVEHPSTRAFPKLFWKPAILLAVGVGLFIVASDRHPWPATIGLVAIAAAFSLAGAKYVGWALTYYVLTTQRVLFVSGIARRRFVTIQLDKISQVQFTQSLFERMLDWGVVHIRAPGQDPPVTSLKDLQNATAFYRELMHEISYGARHDRKPMQGRRPTAPLLQAADLVAASPAAPASSYAAQSFVRTDDTTEMEAIEATSPEFFELLAEPDQ